MVALDTDEEGGSGMPALCSRIPIRYMTGFALGIGDHLIAISSPPLMPIDCW